jgi:hypothetical protein
MGSSNVCLIPSGCLLGPTSRISGLPLRTQVGIIASGVDHIFRMEVLDQNDMTVGSRNRSFVETTASFLETLLYFFV